MSAINTSPLDALEPGEMAGIPAGSAVEFAGRTFSVLGFVGTPEGRGVLFVGADGTPNGPIDLVRYGFIAAMNILVMSIDWTKADPAEVLAVARCQLEHEFLAIHEMHQAVLAAKGKPS